MLLGNPEMRRFSGEGWTRGARALWPLLVVLALFVLGGLTHAGRREVDREIAARDYRLTPGWLVRGFRAYLTNEDDMYRLAAYAQATLGRPYLSYFVRPRVAWDASFARGVQEDPDRTPVVDPHRPLRPYRDFFVEYPPGAFLAFIPPALVTRTPDGYALAFKVEMAALWLFVLALLTSLGRTLGVEPDGRQIRWPRMLAASILALGVVCTHRYDVLVAACMLGAFAAAARGKVGSAGLWLGVAAAAKGVPLLIAPVLGAWLWSERGPRAAARFVAATVATLGSLVVLGLLWGGPGLVEAVAYHEARPVQIESTAGALLGLLAAFRPGLVTVVHSFSSRNLRGDLVPAVGAVTSLLAIAGVAAVSLIAIKRLRDAPDEKARLAVAAESSVAVLAVYVVFSKVFCPQYVIWLLPFALLAARAPGRSGRRLRVGLVLLAVTQLIYPIAYGALKALAPWMTALVLVRNLGILAWAATLMSRTRHQSVTLAAAGDVTNCEPAL
jgi:hypothetical protein